MSLSFTKSEYFRRFIHPVLSRFPLYACWLLHRKSYLKTSGWFQSFKSGKSVDFDGEPIPWFTYGAIELLKERLPDDAFVFEYGCGLGTIWWARHARTVDAVEHDPLWYDSISGRLPENVNLALKELDKNYENAIIETGRKYDVVVVDGKNRIQCVQIALHHLTERGIIIYDDTDREKNIPAIGLLMNAGFKHLRFTGFSPIEFMKCETSFFYREENLLNI